METTEDRPAYLAMAAELDGPVSVAELAELQDEIERERTRHQAADGELRLRRNALITRALNDGIPPGELVRPTGLTGTQLGRIQRGEVSGRRAAARVSVPESDLADES